MNPRTDQGYSYSPLITRKTRPTQNYVTRHPLEALLVQPVHAGESMHNPYGIERPAIYASGEADKPFVAKPFGFNVSQKYELPKSNLNQLPPKQTDASIYRDLIQKNYLGPMQQVPEKPSPLASRLSRREGSSASEQNKMGNGNGRNASIEQFYAEENPKMSRKFENIERNIWPVAGLIGVFNRRENQRARKNSGSAIRLNTEEGEQGVPITRMQSEGISGNQNHIPHNKTFSAQNIDDLDDHQTKSKRLIKAKVTSPKKSSNGKETPVDVELNSLINELLTSPTPSTKNLPYSLDKMRNKNLVQERKSHNEYNIFGGEKLEDKMTSSIPMLGSAVNCAPIEPKGLIGLRNIGNTCFMNSILQSLLNTPLFSSYFLRGDYVNEINHKRSQGIAKAFASLLNKVRAHTGPPSYSSESTVMLKRRIEEVNGMFSGYAQHDAQEFLKTLLEAIHEDLNRVTLKPPYQELKGDSGRSLETISNEWHEYMLKRDNSIVTDLFSGQLLSRAVCSKCKYESIAFDNFWDLSLSFTKNQCELSRMFEHFLKEEVLEDLFYCEKCKKKRKFKKSFAIWRLPKVLVLHLKRFHYGKDKKEKIRNNVVFPVQNLDLSNFVKQSNDESVKDSKYTLFAIVNHSGSLNDGHYTAECMNPYNKKWYDFNDSSVKEARIVKEKDLEAQGESPYMLFYIKTSCL